ncbi:P-loop containing nucleoside triphosphate hydrolase protein [Ganoderma leucocontextum]|nr:P-loop containing nucleoside triphosphate hydrolase protein [Ganoderma leucocontextum]
MKLRGTSVRFLVVSATVPNIADVADWVGNSTNIGPATVKEFGDDFRPCRLSKFVYGIPRRRDANDFVFAKALDYKLYSVLQQHCDNKPVLVFCPTRKGVMMAAEHILKEYDGAQGKKEAVPWTKPPRIEHTFGNKQLDNLAAFGIGVHHAGLEKHDRNATEQLFLKKVLKVLFATSTLAVGVNLPAHTVIIKGVKLFQNGTSQEYSDLDVMQMIGRAGRPQFDKEGVAIIMCELELEAKYKALAQGQTVLESSLHLGLPEHLNSEVALGTITDMETAKEWLRRSFLYRRLQKNPAHYDFRKEGNKTWQERMDELVMESITTLTQADLVDLDAEDSALSSTEYGDIMSKFYIRQGTMVQIIKLSDKATIREILETISCSDEFSDIKFRSGEKQVYNKLRTHNDIRYTLKKIEKPADKVFILIQAILGAVNLSDPAYKTAETQPYTESIPIIRHISRIARAVVEVANVRKAGALLKNALEVMRCLTAKAWEDRSVIFRQLDDIGLKSLKVLAEHNITTFAALRKKDPAFIELLLNRKPPFGHDVLFTVNQLPQYRVSISEVDVLSAKDGVEVELSIECGLVQDLKAPGWKKSKKQKRRDMTIMLTLTSDSAFVDFRRISTSALKDTKTFEVQTKLTKPSQSIIVYMTSDTYAGITVSHTYRPRVDSSVFPVPDTRPQDSLARDLEGLEDVADFWDMEDDGFDEPKVPHPREAPYEESPKRTDALHVGEMRTSLRETNVSKESTSSTAAPSRQLANGNFECNHTCKDKTTCRHLCCRDGLRKPPPMTKKRLEAIVAGDVSPQKAVASSSKAATRSINPRDAMNKPKPRPIVKSDRPLKNLEALHDRMGVKENLHLGDRTRIKLDTDLGSAPPTRKRKPAPNFDLEFAQIHDDRPGKVHLVNPDDLDVSDDDLPDALDLMTGVREPEAQRHGDSSESTDYGDPEFDALIAGLYIPHTGLHAADGQAAVRNSQEACLSAVNQPQLPAGRSRKRRRSISSSDSSPPAKKHTKERDDSPIEILSSPPKAPLFCSSLSDGGDIGRDACQLFRPRTQSSPLTSPAPVPMEEDEGFVLDTSLFDILPSTPTLTEESSIQPSHLGARGSDSTWSLRRVVDSHQTERGQNKEYQPAQAQDEQDDQYEDPLADSVAEFEAWLNSGGVDIVEG